MARDSKKRQKARQRRAVRRRRKRGGRRAQPAVRAVTRQVGAWSLLEVLLSKDWDQEGAIVQILVARRSVLGQVAVGAFLVDLGCLGAKSAFGRLFNSQREYEQTLRREFIEQQPVTSADLNLVAKIVREGIAYAHQLGFDPDPDYRQAMRVLGDADPDACPTHVPLGGKDGKPFFIAGPYDDVPSIMAKLTRALGPGGFHYIAPIDPDTEFQ